MYPYKQANRHRGPRIDEHRLVVERQLGRKLGRFEFSSTTSGRTWTCSTCRAWCGG